MGSTYNIVKDLFYYGLEGQCKSLAEDSGVAGASLANLKKGDSRFSLIRMEKLAESEFYATATVIIALVNLVLTVVRVPIKTLNHLIQWKLTPPAGLIFDFNFLLDYDSNKNCFIDIKNAFGYGYDSVIKFFSPTILEDN